MNRTYWIRRQREAILLAKDSSDLEGCIVHTELARRYGDKAGDAQEPQAPELNDKHTLPSVFDL